MTARRTLLLDLDGTLVDTVDDLATALNLVLRRRGLAEASRAETMAMIGNGVHALLAAAFAARAVPLDDGAVPEFMEHYGAHAADLSRPFPGVIDALRELSAQDWQLAVCTNKPVAAARSLVAAVGLAPWCMVIGGGDSYAVRKPDPGHLLGTLADAGGRADAAIMVGDHANDVQAAKGAGLPCIFALWGYGPAAMGTGAAAQIRHAADLPAACERLLPAG